MRTIFLIFLLASSSLAAGPKRTFRDPLLNDEFENVYKDIKTSTANGIRGTTTNNNAATGNYGEYISSTSVGTQSFGTSGQFSDLLQISLTPGDWDVSLLYSATANAATVTEVACGISPTAGNSTVGMTDGDSYSWNVGPNATHDQECVIPAVRVSLAATTTYYLKFLGSYTVATPLARGRISARRVR